MGRYGNNDTKEGATGDEKASAPAKGRCGCFSQNRFSQYSIGTPTYSTHMSTAMALLQNEIMMCLSLCHYVG